MAVEFLHNRRQRLTVKHQPARAPGKGSLDVGLTHLYRAPGLRFSLAARHDSHRTAARHFGVNRSSAAVRARASSARQISTDGSPSIDSISSSSLSLWGRRLRASSSHS
jgi:hypothetical protein